MRNYLLLIFLFNITSTFAQDITGAALLERSIQYHDPNGNWQSFEGTLQLSQDTPKRKDEKATVYFNNKTGFFKHTKAGEDGIVERSVNNDSCYFYLNNSTDIDSSLIKKHRLNCKRNKLLRNYYLYLYGLPMKLKDDGTIVNQRVNLANFQGIECLALKVNYKPEVGDDVWYFYFDKVTYALIGYRFYHEESKNDGEYITLSGEKIINEIRIPKVRKWYYNKDDKYLGTDTLK